jgi:hypothetical protein
MFANKIHQQRKGPDAMNADPQDLLCIENDGGKILATNYWQSEYARRGFVLLSYNAHEFRLMVPPALYTDIPEMRKGAKAFVISVLPPEKWRPSKAAAELLIEDGSDAPFAIHISSNLFTTLPGESAVGKLLTASIWREKHGKPKRLLQRPAVYQIVPTLPWLRRTWAEQLYEQWQKDRLSKT